MILSYCEDNVARIFCVSWDPMLFETFTFFALALYSPPLIVNVSCLSFCIFHFILFSFFSFTLLERGYSHGSHVRNLKKIYSHGTLVLRWPERGNPNLTNPNLTLQLILTLTLTLWVRKIH